MTRPMPNSLKLTFPIHPVWCTVALGTSTCYQLRFFFNLEKGKVCYSTQLTMAFLH